MYLRTEQEIMKNWDITIHTPIVSVNCITYNHEAYISDAINSFLMQETEFPFEIIIGEDCSTDNTRLFINEYLKKYPNIIKLITSEYNVGMQKNGIRTLKSCKGKYIAFCEGDDYWTDSKKLQIQVDKMNNNPVYDLSIHYSSAYDVQLLKKVKKWKFEDNEITYTTSDVLSTSGQFASTSSYMIRQTLILKYSHIFYKELPIGDFFIELYGSLRGGILYLPYEMSSYRINVNGSWSQRYSSNLSSNKTLEYFIEMKDLMIDFKKNNPKHSKYIDVKLSAFYYGESIYYLLNNNFKDFKDSINTSYLLDNNLNKFKKIIFIFRNIPSLAKYIFLMKLKLNK